MIVCLGNPLFGVQRAMVRPSPPGKLNVKLATDLAYILVFNILLLFSRLFKCFFAFFENF